jgi:hypothetical protein
MLTEIPFKTIHNNSNNDDDKIIQFVTLAIECVQFIKWGRERLRK